MRPTMKREIERESPNMAEVRVADISISNLGKFDIY